MSFEKCIKCEKRHPACQDTCEYMIAEKNRIEEEQRIINERKKQEKDGRDYIYEHYDKTRR